MPYPGSESFAPHFFFLVLCCRLQVAGQTRNHHAATTHRHLPPTQSQAYFFGNDSGAAFLAWALAGWASCFPLYTTSLRANGRTSRNLVIASSFSLSAAFAPDAHTTQPRSPLRRADVDRQFFFSFFSSGASQCCPF